MNDHVTGIDQYPIAIGQTLDVGLGDSVFLETFCKVLRDGARKTGVLVFAYS